jgi:MFS family permease
MIDLTGSHRAALTMVGGVLWSVVLALDDIAPDLVGLAAVVPVLIGFGVLELYGRFGDRYGSAGRAGVALTGFGLGSLLIAVVLYATSPPALVAVLLVAVPGVTGAATLALGSALLAVALYRLGVLDLPVALLLGLGVPLTPLVGALLAAAVGAGTALTAAVPGGVVTGLGGVPYGVAWVSIGRRLRRTAGDDRRARAADDTRTIEVHPHAVTAVVVGGTLVLLSAGRFLPLGPLSGTPWVNQSLALDVGHLLAGTAGVAVGVVGNTRAARAYDRAAGLLFLSLVALTLLGTFQDVRWLSPLARDLLDLNLPDVLLHLPAGVVLAVVGFGVDGTAAGDGGSRPNAR